MFRRQRPELLKALTRAIKTERIQICPYQLIDDFERAVITRLLFGCFGRVECRVDGVDEAAVVAFVISRLTVGEGFYRVRNDGKADLLGEVGKEGLGFGDGLEMSKTKLAGKFSRPDITYFRTASMSPS
jgi:hypothetical protein